MKDFNIDIDILKAKLRAINNEYSEDPEVAHSLADNALLEFIDDAEVVDLFYDIEKWHA